MDSIISIWRATFGRISDHSGKEVTRLSTGGSPAAAYNPFTLYAIYDWLVLGLYCRWAWRCDSPTIRNLYRSVTGAASDSLSTEGLRILDIGVGTGYFPAHAGPFPRNTSITLFDLNPACLDVAESRLQAAFSDDITVEKLCGDFLAPTGTSTSPAAPNSLHTLLAAEAKYDCIFTTLLLHCLPGPPSGKATALCSLARYVEPRRGVLAGVTVLGRGVQHNWLGRWLMFVHNAAGVFSNQEDDTMAFVGPLKDAFADVQWKLVGTTLMFEARGPRTGLGLTVWRDY